MKHILYFLFFLLFLFLSACSNSRFLTPHNIAALEKENYDEVLRVYKKNCQTRKAQKLYGSLCENLDTITDAREFFLQNFDLMRIGNADEEGLLTGYYEPLLHGSLHKSEKYPFALYEQPNDLLEIRLGSLYPELKKYRLRGRLKNGVIIPYFSRSEAKQRELNASVICYCDSKIERFFLEVQGSGRVELDDGRQIYIGYSNQNGHPYTSIGKYLIKKGMIAKKDISLQSIQAYLQSHPQEVDEILNQNSSMVFFKKRNHSASGALGVILTPWRSVAIDSSVVALGSMLYIETKKPQIQKIVFAQDRGGAIKGSLRADLFLGSSKEAQEIAGKLQAPLKMWVFIPKKKKSMYE